MEAPYHPGTTPGAPSGANLLPGRSPGSTLEPPLKLGVAPLYTPWQPLPTLTPHTLCPQDFVSSFLSQIEPRPSYCWSLWLLPSAHPCCCSRGAEGQQGILNATFLRVALLRKLETRVGGTEGAKREKERNRQETKEWRGGRTGDLRACVMLSGRVLWFSPQHCTKERRKERREGRRMLARDQTPQRGPSIGL